MRRCLAFACLLVAGRAPGVEPPVEPILRVDPGMHTAMIRRIGVDARGTWLITVSDDKTARVWDLATGQLQRVLRPPIGLGNEGKLSSVDLSPDGATVALGGWTGFNNGSSTTSPDGHSIFLFDRASGRLIKHIPGLPAVINALAFSPDGHYLAAGLGGQAGVRVFEVSSGEQVGADAQYTEVIEGIDFSRDGRLVSTSYDGNLRLYEMGKSGLNLLTKAAPPGGKRPFHVRFSPDGKMIVVGFADSPTVNVLDGATLALRNAPDTSSAENRTLAAVAWSSDGSTLFAGGSYKVNEFNAVRQWAHAGQGSPHDTPASADLLTDFRGLPGGGAVFAAADPAWGQVDAGGQRTRLITGPIADLRNNRDGFQVSADGHTVRFSFENYGKAPARFDLERGLSMEAAGAPPLIAPRTDAPGVALSDWRNSATPKLNETLLKLRRYEVARSVAITPDGERFMLGADFSIHAFDRAGTELWQIPTPSVAWAVNIAGNGTIVVAAIGDGTIRWYDLKNGHEKLALFAHADRKRWVAWTPSGYYQASPGGEDLIGWHLNHGKENAADFFPASRLRSWFSRADIVARALSTASDADARRLADAESGRNAESRPSNLAVLLPPVIEILSPLDHSSVAEGKISIRYATRAPAEAPVTGLRARVNGQAVSLLEARGLTPTARGAEREVIVPIRAEDSEIQLFAENQNGVSTPAIVRLSWGGRGSSAVAEAIPKPKLYVLSVGVAQYANPDYNLDLPSKDARDFANVLLRQKGLLYSEVKVRLLIDADATRAKVLDGLDWLQKQVTAHDVGMMFLAGHGKNDNSGKYYFLPHDADPDKLLSSGVPQGEIRDTLSSVAGKVVFFLDTCHSGNALGTAKTRGVDDVNGFVNDLSAAENGVVVFTASTGRQLSLEDPAWGNGAFTKAVVEGLNGKADFQKSGSITHKALDYYVAERVKELTDGRQSPVSIAPAGLPDFPIALVSK